MNSIVHHLSALVFLFYLERSLLQIYLEQALIHTKLTGEVEQFCLDLFQISRLLIVLFLLQFKSIIMFKILAKINKVILPSLYKKDITRLKSFEKVILGYRYWVTKNSL